MAPARTISLVTPCHGAAIRFLDETARSVALGRIAAASAGWSLQWLVVLDGPVGDRPHPPTASELGADRVLVLDQRAGAATARNRALAYLDDPARAWIYPLDADDLLDPSGLAGLLASGCLDDPDLDWVATSRTLIDGTPCAFTVDEEHVVSRWSFLDEFSLPAAFHANSVAVRADALLSLGGWPAVLGHEDMALLAALSDAGNGLAVAHVLTRYRIWEGQTIRQPWLTEVRAENLERLVAAANARRRRAGRPPCVSVPAPIERDATGMPSVG